MVNFKAYFYRLRLVYPQQLRFQSRYPSLHSCLHWAMLWKAPYYFWFLIAQKPRPRSLRLFAKPSPLSCIYLPMGHVLEGLMKRSVVLKHEVLLRQLIGLVKFKPFFVIKIWVVSSVFLVGLIGSFKTRPRALFWKTMYCRCPAFSPFAMRC